MKALDIDKALRPKRFSPRCWQHEVDVSGTKDKPTSAREARREESAPRAKVEAVLRKFATAEPASANAIPYSFLIPGISRLIVLGARGDIPTVSRSKVRKKKTKKVKVRTKLIKLRKAAEALLSSDPSLSVSLSREERLAIVQIAYVNTVLKGRRGAPRKGAATRVARLLAQHFEALTGSPPTRITQVQEGVAQRCSGRFVNCLAEIYEALGIEASVENQAKSAIKSMEINRPKI